MNCPHFAHKAGIEAQRVDPIEYCISALRYLGNIDGDYLDNYSISSYVGIPDEAQIERVKAFIVLKDPAKATPDMGKALISHCQEQLIKWSCPRDVEFRNTLPLPRVGKVAYTVLEQEEIARLKAAGKYAGK